MSKEENNFEKAQAELIQDLLKEAKEHNNESSVKLLNEVINGYDKNMPDYSENTVIKKDPVLKNKKAAKVYDLDEDFEDCDNNFDPYDNFMIDDLDVPHDLVPLPSKGLIYKGVKSKIPVAYLTASDEDLITSPNLYADGKIIDLLLRKKIIDNSIDPEALCTGDRDAIIVWLRASGYGSNFPVSVNDPSTLKSFETEIDLSTLKYKEFNLKSDSDGYFDFKLPKTGHVVKFKFLSHKDESNYVRFLGKSNDAIKKASVNISYMSLKNIIESEKDIDSKLKDKLTEAVNSISEYLGTIDDKDKQAYLKNVTYLLERSVVSIDGNSDRSFIKKYIKAMPAFDSLSLRKHINENTPGVDFRVTVERPESLGGGSFETFLNLEPTVFLNISRL